MKKSYSIGNYVVRNFLIACFNLSIVFGLITLLNYELTLYEVIKISFILILMIALTFYNRVTFTTAMFLLFIFLGASVLDKEDSGFNLYYFIGDFIDAIQHSMVSHKFPTYFQDTMLTVIILSLDLVLYFFEFRLKRFNPIIIILPGLLLYTLPGFFNMNASFEGFLLFAFASMLYYMMYQYRKNDNSNALQYLVGFVLTAVFSLMVLTSSAYVHVNYPDSLNFIKDIAYYVQSLDIFEDSPLNGGTVVYDYQKTNFEGLENQDQTVVMTLTKSDADYLIGTTYLEYEDNNWAKSSDELSISIELDTYYSTLLEQSLFGIHHLRMLSYGVPLNELTLPNTLTLEDYPIKADEMTIEYNNLVSYALFKPYNVQGIIPDSAMATTENEYTLSFQDNISARYPLKQGTTYEVSSIHYNFDDPVFHNYLRQSYIGLDTDLTEGRDLAYRKDSLATTEAYMNIPDTIDPEVYTLTENITAPYQTNYDKVRAIESYLASQFTYTLDVPPVPENADFISYFLLETGEGYCTYYASSMAMMVRMLGLPSRYVTGYRIPSIDMEEYENIYDPDLMDTETVTIREQNAHAWVEVYFEGFGWMPFEPTAPFFTSYRNALPEEEVITPFDPTDIANQPETPDEETVFLTEEMKGRIKLIFWILLLLSPFMYKTYRVISFKAQNNTNKVIFAYKRILYGYKLLKLGKQPYETASDYCKRVHHELWYIDDSFDDVTKIFEKARYSSDNITDEEVDILITYLLFIKDKINKQYFLIKPIKFWLKY
ncbi:DUF4129 domain-containing transglutaminase family protein [Vallitalea okinawensis]|uniref:DUF4129 domain-containing transglutaminase family protein n=1 Tax=Vallitalea okinawensis TaxID=2078660 RepID=UPI000CFC5582|nr:transglutaminase domain-containing protein [Vallitalea okinawensis]